MTRRALKVCSTPGCPELVERGKCDTCRSDAERARGSARERGYDERWRRTRAAFLREHPFCGAPDCLALAVDVDHIDGQGPLGERGHDWLNLRGFCRPHHSQRTARDQPGGWNRR